MRNDFSFKATITKEEVAELPLHKFSGEVVYIETLENFDKVIHEIENVPFLGFDTETRPTFKKGRLNDVALLQLSTNDTAYLFRLNKIGLPKRLAKILANKHIEKVGVAIHDDISTLQKLQDFKPAGFVELQQFVKKYGIEDNGLKKLTANILGFNISKRQQTSNWEQEQLSVPQIEYAATDAWVCYEIYNTLIQNKNVG